MSRLLVLPVVSVGLAVAVDFLVSLLAAADPDTAPNLHHSRLDIAHLCSAWSIGNIVAAAESLAQAIADSCVRFERSQRIQMGHKARVDKNMDKLRYIDSRSIEKVTTGV